MSNQPHAKQQHDHRRECDHEDVSHQALRTLVQKGPFAKIESHQVGSALKEGSIKDINSALHSLTARDAPGLELHHRPAAAVQRGDALGLGFSQDDDAGDLTAEVASPQSDAIVGSVVDRQALAQGRIANPFAPYQPADEDPKHSAVCRVVSMTYP